MRRTHSFRSLWSVGLAAVLTASCTSTSSNGAAGLPTAPSVVNIRLEDNRFVYDKAIPPGRTIFKVMNYGKEDHNLVMSPVTPDYPPIDEQLHGDVRRGLEHFAQVFPRRPGESGSFAVDLQPGQRYVFLCLMGDSAGVSHALKGMNSEFTPSETASAPTRRPAP